MIDWDKLQCPSTPWPRLASFTHAGDTPQIRMPVRRICGQISALEEARPGAAVPLAKARGLILTEQG